MSVMFKNAKRLPCDSHHAEWSKLCRTQRVACGQTLNLPSFAKSFIITNGLVIVVSYCTLGTKKGFVRVRYL